MKYAFTDDNKFECYFDYSLKGEIKSFKEELKEHFKKITNNCAHVYLLFSGGMDSRFIALILLELKIDFTAITYGFSKNFTDYDSRVSSEFAKKHGFKHEIFYLDINEVIECVYKYHTKGFFVPILNSYYLLLAVNRYYKTESIFITGAASEFKILKGKVDIPWNFLVVKKERPCLCNFMTERIFFSYFEEETIKANWKNESLGMFGARNKLYNQIYPDKLNIITKTPPDDKNINDYFYNIACSKYGKYYKELFLRKKFIIDLETHYKKWENT
jgi:hypothetical protein